jgi:hypothetical protein
LTIKARQDGSGWVAESPKRNRRGVTCLCLGWRKLNAGGQRHRRTGRGATRMRIRMLTSILCDAMRGRWSLEACIWRVRGHLHGQGGKDAWLWLWLYGIEDKAGGDVKTLFRRRCRLKVAFAGVRKSWCWLWLWQSFLSLSLALQRRGACKRVCLGLLQYSYCMGITLS